MELHRFLWLIARLRVKRESVDTVVGSDVSLYSVAPFQRSVLTSDYGNNKSKSVMMSPSSVFAVIARYITRAVIRSIQLNLTRGRPATPGAVCVRVSLDVPLDRSPRLWRLPVRSVEILSCLSQSSRKESDCLRLFSITRTFSFIVDFLSHSRSDKIAIDEF